MAGSTGVGTCILVMRSIVRSFGFVPLLKNADKRPEVLGRLSQGILGFDAQRLKDRRCRSKAFCG